MNITRATDLSNTIDFLLRYYSRENIQKPRRMNESHHGRELLSRQERHVYETEEFSMNLSKATLTQSNSFTFVYICLSAILVMLIVRHQYCSTKRERYTV